MRIMAQGSCMHETLEYAHIYVPINHWIVGKHQNAMHGYAWAQLCCAANVSWRPNTSLNGRMSEHGCTHMHMKTTRNYQHKLKACTDILMHANSKGGKYVCMYTLQHTGSCTVCERKH